MTKAKKKDLKASVEDQIQEMLASSDEPSEGRMKLLALGIKMCALNAKLEESEYGDFFTESGSPAGDEKGEKPSGGRRKNGATDLSGLT